MRSYDCTPVSTPQLPPTHQHPMWKAWDLAVDVSLGTIHILRKHFYSTKLVLASKVFKKLGFFVETAEFIIQHYILTKFSF